MNAINAAEEMLVATTISPIVSTLVINSNETKIIRKKKGEGKDYNKTNEDRS